MKKLIFLSLAAAALLTSCMPSKYLKPGSPIMFIRSKNDSVAIVYFKGNAAHFADRKARAGRRAKADSLAAVAAADEYK